MKKSYLFGILVLFTLGIVADSVLAADQFINCRKFGSSVKIKIDGDPSDWPIASFGDPATLPDIDPAEQFTGPASTNALDPMALKTGDHFVWNIKKVLINSGSGQTASDAWGPNDFAATTYIGWDDTGMYVLNVVTDSTIGWYNGQADRDTSNSPAYTNDGIELWFDNADDKLPPNINTDPSSDEDLQLDVDIDDAVSKEEFGEVLTQSNGNPLEINMFRTALNTDDDAENAILAKIIHVAKLDSKAAGSHTSYVQEIFLPWKVFPKFESTHPIGFNLNWMNWDATQFVLMRWDQADESEVEYFRDMHFTSDQPLGATDINDWSLF